MRMLSFRARRGSNSSNSSGSTACCGASDTGSECGSLLRQGGPDTQQQPGLPAATRALEEWSFPSMRSGLRPAQSYSGGGFRMFSRLATHGAAFPSDEVQEGALSPSGGCGDRGRHELMQQLQQRRALLQAGVSDTNNCCCCSDSSTQSGGGGEAAALRPRWGAGCCSPAESDLEQQPQHPLCVLLNLPTLIETSGLRCLILDAPSNENLHAYLSEMHSVGVTDLVRTCYPTYDDEAVIASGIRVHDLTFPDGEPPPTNIIARWRALAAKTSGEGSVLAVHCVAGLGRGPVLVAMSLIDRGFSAEDAVNFIRARRKGAINRRQLVFLHNYRRHAMASKRCMRGCSIM